MRKTWILTVALAATLGIGSVASAGPVSQAKDAVDPDCTVGKAAKGAAERAAVGVGNRCTPAETARDALGVDGGKKHDKGNGPINKRSKD